MKFVLGLLAGMLGVVSLSTLTSLDWSPPKRMLELPVNAAHVDSEVVLAPLESEDPPLASVTIEPLIAEPAPAAAPRPEAERSPPHVPIDALRADTTDVQADTEERTLNEDPQLEESAAAAVAWKPFHSEVSAQGFARRLSVQLGYPFRAQRMGPATYHVVFDYTTDEQRELLHNQVHQLTGFRGL